MNLFELIDDTPKHNTFISFHHEDEYYKYEIETDWGNYADGFISKAVGDGDMIQASRQRPFGRRFEMSSSPKRPSPWY